MRFLPRRAGPPEDGWFQIGDMPEPVTPGRRGSGRVSLSVVQHEPEAATDTVTRVPLADRANATAERVLALITEVRYGALAVCGSALALVLLVIVIIASPGGGSSSSKPSAAALDREQAQVAQLESELRSSRQQLAAATVAASNARHTTANTTATRARDQHQSRKGGQH